ncbi:hypothetical protein BU25DRAFT_72660 [Macroventuria anomochaeta]|uniref:Uncharacterized protein n=1 Tax=Macroventuria anomochaeta TaxID=301207 RepID=A0ACB6RYN0_9PLEO|nr:uncharacterized protein BU25DRAFT_72660 [Macroventuria anomochaeta]KAF2626822.1 hypothetical protein BU25DRAFT_72660 [Macroventuria anomochaeta]
MWKAQMTGSPSKKQERRLTRGNGPHLVPLRYCRQASLHPQRQHSATRQWPSGNDNWRQDAGVLTKRLLWLPSRGWTLAEDQLLPCSLDLVRGIWTAHSTVTWRCK